MNYQSIILEQNNGVAVIRLNRPEKMNGMNQLMCEELLRATEAVAADSDVRVLVITGRGKAFCAGGDLESSMYDIKDAVVMKRLIMDFGRISLNLRNMGKPVIAMVNGAAAGGGFGLALAADIIIASETARLGHVYVNIGAQSDFGAIYFLPRLVGLAKAAELVFTGKVITAQEAERIGLVNRVVPADQLEAETMKMAARIAAGPSLAIGLAKKALYKCFTMDAGSAVEYEADGHLLTMLSDDMKEGIAAFKEKRAPVFPSNRGAKIIKDK